jgi:hypothetical protein
MAFNLYRKNYYPKSKCNLKGCEKRWYNTLKESYTGGMTTVWEHHFDCRTEEEKAEDEAKL